jgi:hypothetical protein
MVGDATGRNQQIAFKIHGTVRGPPPGRMTISARTSSTMPARARHDDVGPAAQMQSVSSVLCDWSLSR